jgi:hypothetical protein
VTQEAERIRAKALITNLAAAEVTLDDLLSPALKRALGFERRVRDRQPRRVRQETEIALRQARQLVTFLEAAQAALPAERAS